MNFNQDCTVFEALGGGGGVGGGVAGQRGQWGIPLYRPYRYVPPLSDRVFAPF